ncbi:MAG: hypothetical protein Q8M94_04635 [Ignavibacteria bacterium]|nr:hypothetical protein [Ignavibacteria bacterium]
MKKALIIIAIIAIVAIAGSLIYYFVFFRSGIEKSEINKELHLWYGRNRGKEVEKEIIELIKSEIIL